MSARNGNAKVREHLGVDTAKSLDNSANYETIKAALQSSRDLRPVDYAPEQRPSVVYIAAQLREASNAE